MEEEQKTSNSIPVITAIFMIVNIVVYVVLEILGDTTDAYFMYQHGAAFPQDIVEEGEYYRLFTCMFLHFGMEHLLNNMVLLGCLGARIEAYAGHIPFFILYLLSGLGSGIVSVAEMLKTGEYAVSAGASGAIYGLMGALLIIAIKNKGRVEGLSAKGLLFMALLSIYFSVTTANVDLFGHLGGLVTGAVIGIFVRKKREKKVWND